MAASLAAHAPAYQAAGAAVRFPDGSIRLAVAGSAGGEAVTFDDSFRIASLTKSFTAALVLLLVEDGLVSLDASAASYGVPIPSHITVRQLLRHESGLRDYLKELIAQDRLYEVHTPEELISIALASNLAVDASGYSNTNYIALGMVIEAVTGKSYEVNLASRILIPLGLERTSLEGYLVGVTPVPGVRPGATGYISAVGTMNPSNAWAAGGMISSPEDVARWLEALFLHRKVLAPPLYDELVAANAKGLGFGVMVQSPSRFFHDGSSPAGACAWMGVDRESGTAAIVLTNTYSSAACSGAASVARAALGW